MANQTVRQRIRQRVGGAAHYLTAFIILMHGYEKMEKGEGTYWLFYVAGVAVLLTTLLHHKLEKWGPVYRIFHGVEAAVLFLIAFDYFRHGKTALPLCYLAAGIGHLIAIWVKNKKAATSNVTVTHQ